MGCAFGGLKTNSDALPQHDKVGDIIIDENEVDQHQKFLTPVDSPPSPLFPRLKMPLQLLKIALISLLLSACSPAPEKAGLSIDDPWVREAPPGMQMMAGYATLNNATDTPIHVVSVSSDAFKMIEMHTTEIIDGVARMLEQETLSVPANGSLALAPGGFHLMLMQPAKQLKASDRVNITLVLDNGEEKRVEFEVKKGGAMGGH